MPSIPLTHSFFFNYTANTAIYTLSLHELFRSVQPAHDLARSQHPLRMQHYSGDRLIGIGHPVDDLPSRDRKSTRLNSSHLGISYTVLCLQKKKQKKYRQK